ncbi:MAG: hypothetical protein U5L96_10885 [Owenweeksia sp.]|nr:hypothetical protein [Owenweeksia sp.]
MAIDSDIDIIILPLPRYDGDYSSTIFSLATEFSKTNRTFYLDNPMTLKDISTRFQDEKVKKRWQKRSRKGGWYENILTQAIYSLLSPIVLPINFLPRWIYPIFRKFNSYLNKKTNQCLNPKI